MSFLARLKRSPLRRMALKRKRQADPVSPQLRADLWRRDFGYCVAARLDRQHRCRNQWGDEMRPDFSPGLTVEHVLDEARMGRRAPSDLEHTALLCHGANAWEHWGSKNRDKLRAYIKAANERMAA